MTRFELLVRGGAVVTSADVSVMDVAVSGGEIVEVTSEIAGSAREEIDARGLHVLPGAVDIHVHFNDPGRTEWEGWATGSAACTVGGTTTVAEMPLNANPPTLDGPSFDVKRKAAKASSRVDFGLWGGLTPANLERMEELTERGVIGFKAFMSSSGIDDFPMADDATLFTGMQRAAALGLPVAVHAENDTLTAALAARAIATGRDGARDYLASRPAIAEIEAIVRAILFAEETGCALHVVHVSTGAASRRLPRLAPVGSTSRPRPARTISYSMRTTSNGSARLLSALPPATPLRGRSALACRRAGRDPGHRLRSFSRASRHEDRR